MARTQGHGNPSWTREETILALELYYLLGERMPDGRDEKVVELSRELRALPYHAVAARQPTFRNPDGVAFKVGNIRSLATGKGLSNVSAMDRAVWAELGGERDEVTRLAALIRSELCAPVVVQDPELEDDEFYEGRLLTVKHVTRERNRKLRKRLIEARRAEGLSCDVCGVTHDHLPEDIVDAAFEAHHVISVADAGERKTKVTDLALLCATCHRLLHRVIARGRVWVSVDEARAVLRP